MLVYISSLEGDSVENFISIMVIIYTLCIMHYALCIIPPTLLFKIKVLITRCPPYSNAQALYAGEPVTNLLFTVLVLMDSLLLWIGGSYGKPPQHIPL
jgi:hypothetical protein